MQTMFEYIDDQHQGFDEKPFNDADAVILSTLANLDLSYFYDQYDEEKVSLKQLAEDFIKRCCSENDPSQECILLKKLSNSERYQKIKVSDAVHEIDKNSVKQFGAVTYWPTEDLAYVGFAGTGTSIVGYKEDLHMCFMDIVPSQEDAVRYLNGIGDKLPESFYVGGFSKGGNLAVFASAFTKPEIRERIKTVYNHDGPGFSELIQNEEKYKTLKPYIKSYIPRASIVGLLLEEKDDYKIIESSNLPIAQHQPYSWFFEGDDLKVIDNLSRTSNFFLKMQKELLEDIPEEKRADLIDSVFDIIYGVDADDFITFVEKGKKVIPALRESWKQADKLTRHNVKHLAKQLGKTFFKSFRKRD